MLSLIPKIEQLSLRVIRVLGCNPNKMTLQGTNTYIVGTGAERVLIDTGDANVTEYITNLQECLNKFSISIHAIVLTHWHNDHVGGINDLLRHNIIDANTTLYKFPLHENEHPNNKLLRYTFVQDQEVVKTQGATLKMIYTPGHTEDHVSLHLLEDNAIFSGDCVLGEGTAVFEDLYTYMKSLQLLSDLKPDIVYPGHGKVIDKPVEHIKYYIEHRNERESQILGCLKQCFPNSIESMQIVKQLYTDVPVLLHIPAEKNVHNHLLKLQKEGKVTEHGGKWMVSKL